MVTNHKRSGFYSTTQMYYKFLYKSFFDLFLLTVCEYFSSELTTRRLRS